MSRYSITLLVLLLACKEAACQPKPNALTAEEAAQGWLLLFDGTTAPELRVEGDLDIKDGVLVAGGARATRLHIKPLLGGNYELHLQYRTEGRGPIMVHLEWSGFLGQGGTSSSLNRLSRDPAEWIDMVLRGHYDPANDTHSSSADMRSEFAISNQGFGGGRGNHARTLTLEIPAGTRLHVRNLKLKTEPPAADDRVFYISALAVALLFFLFFALLLRRKRTAAQLDFKLTARTP